MSVLFTWLALGVLRQLHAQTVIDCATEDGQPCQFPYIYEGETRFECTKIVNRSRKEAFCPIKKDQNGEVEEWRTCGTQCPLMAYHGHAEFLEEFQDLVDAFPEHSTIFTIGESRNGASLSGIRISRDLRSRPEGFQFRPRVKLIANMHGNEPLGREILIHMAKHLLYSDQNEGPRAREILSNIDLYILPTMNPDGFARAKKGRCIGENYWAGRLNEGFQDLNRDFPNWWDWNHHRANGSYDIYHKRQDETKAVMDWTMHGYFTLSLNYHDGAVVVSIPWENYHGSDQKLGAHASPDEDTFYHLATAYSLNHMTMNETARACPKWGTFENGVTNSADWYVVNGSMPEFNYLFAGTFEILVEVSCCKYPSQYKLIREWENNRNGLLAFVEQAYATGIQGTVKTRTGKHVQDAKIVIREVSTRKSPGEWERYPVRSDLKGIYTRIVTQPGQYEAKVYMEDRDSKQGGKVVIKVQSHPVPFRIQSGAKHLQRLDLTLPLPL